MAEGLKPKRYAPEVRELAVRRAKDHLHEYDSQRRDAFDRREDRLLFKPAGGGATRTAIK